MLISRLNGVLPDKIYKAEIFTLKKYQLYIIIIITHDFTPSNTVAFRKTQ